MKKHIIVELSASSINKAIQALRHYEKWLDGKCEELRQAVAEKLAEYAQTGFNGSIADDMLNESPILPDVKVTWDNRGDVTIVMAEGKDAVFIEFGAGVFHNGAGVSPNPLGVDLGFTIGGYGNGNGQKNVWGFYGEDGELHLTHGTPASMPMYTAMMQILDELPQIAKEVFQK